MNYPDDYFATGNIPFPANLKLPTTSGSIARVDDEVEYFFRDYDEAEDWLSKVEKICPNAWLSWENSDYHPTFRGPTPEARAAVAVEFYRSQRDYAQSMMDLYSNGSL